MKIFQITIVLILAIYGIIIETKWKKISVGKRVLGIISILVAIVIGWNSYEDLQKENVLEKINSKIGDIWHDGDVYYPELQFGYGRATFISQHGEVKWQMGNETLFRLYVKNNKLIFYGIIRDKDGEVIAGVYDNEWEIFKTGYEYNSDDHGFEVVVAGERTVFFQIDLKDSIAHISGFIFNNDGNGIYVCAAPNGGSFLTTLKKDEYFEPTYIKPIFKYPREKYLGLRDTTKIDLSKFPIDKTVLFKNVSSFDSALKEDEMALSSNPNDYSANYLVGLDYYNRSFSLISDNKELTRISESKNGLHKLDSMLILSDYIFKIGLPYLLKSYRILDARPKLNKKELYDYRQDISILKDYYARYSNNNQINENHMKMYKILDKKLKYADSKYQQ